MEIQNAQAYRDEAVMLLKNARLPFEDLPATLDNFIVAISDDQVIGVAGIEVYGNNGLLRSVAVAPAYQGQSVAGGLLSAIEAMAEAKGVRQLILLTETAAPYFERKGFKFINREEVPEEVKSSSEFSHICPVSAAVLSKTLITHI